MKRCGCGDDRMGLVVDIAWGRLHQPRGVVYLCPGCGGDCEIPWADAPEQIRAEAVEQYRLRLALHA